ncbi:hypothetical protein GCM10028824_15430 [Hymenobacter segetis]
MSMMKTSGSKRKYVQSGDFADTRNSKAKSDLEELPQFESVKSSRKFYNGKINYGLLVRFLRGKVGNDWDEVYSEIINRIPVALLEYKEMIFWFVADKVVFEDEKLWNKKNQRFIWRGEAYSYFSHYSQIYLNPEFIEFYVHPDTNILEHIPQLSFKKRAKTIRN